MDTTFAALMSAAFLTAVLHTVAGPDHYLPFIAIAKSRGYGLARTLFWTFLCGVGHIGSALLVAVAFMYFSHLLSESRMEWLEANRSNLAAYFMIGFGLAYVLFSLRHRWLHKHGHQHSHEMPRDNSIVPWVIFIIFVLGPCEALLPLLTAASVLGVPAVLATTVLFSVSTIATMMIVVAAGVCGLKALRFKALENYASEIAGATVAACGCAIIFLGL